MNEIPEAITLAQQITETLVGKTIISVIPASTPHKFAWYYDDPAKYHQRLLEAEILSARGIGMFVEINLSKAILLFSDGVRLRFHPVRDQIPGKHQLLLGFNDGTFLSASVSMYGGLFCWEKEVKFDNIYYEVAKSKPSPLKDAFDADYFNRLFAPEAVQKLSLKAALATEQRIPGLGNGCLQDILWHAKLNPKRKVTTLTEDEILNLFTNLKQILAEMTRLGGRSTEKDLFGNSGGYSVVMCADNKDKPCPDCGTPIQKEAYMGGSVYTCPTCQPL